MPRKSFKMSFNDLKLINLSFVVNKEFDQKKAIEINTAISSAFKFEKAKKILNLRLKISLSEGNTPFFFEIESEGVFTFQTNPHKNVLEAVSQINGPAIMFPYIRETIADLTRRAGFSPLHIQPINFVEIAKQHKLSLSESKKATTPEKESKKRQSR